jgi:NADH:ubiquinone oxidoreductase subunit 5 (subunit L)/multisubunit Na+/H+ antiporter MnhA subunit
LGLSTITIASLSALNEKDIKKMVALSTLRQLGLIIRSLGCQWVFIRFIHIILHAYFKAIMFISVGNLIHFSQNYQALHNRGILYFRSPLNGSTLILASISLCGAPFSAAFFSKEPIIELTCHSAEFLGPLIIILIRVILTMLYRRRLIKLTLISYRTIKSRASLAENDFLLTKGIIRLSVPSFSSGAIISRIMIVKPCRFVYSIGVKYFIISRLFLVIIILFIAKFPIFKIGGGLTLSL